MTFAREEVVEVGTCEGPEMSEVGARMERVGDEKAVRVGEGEFGGLAGWALGVFGGGGVGLEF